jgi:hypothetical protein
MIFRFHRGGLEESINTCVEVNSIEQLVDIIQGSFREDHKINPEDIVIEYAIYDERIKWNTYFVYVKNTFGNVRSLIGMSNSDKF